MKNARRLMWGALAGAAVACAGVIWWAMNEAPIAPARATVEARPETKVGEPPPAPVETPAIIDRDAVLAPFDEPSWSPGDVPPDVRDRGKSTLLLRLVEDTDHAPVVMDCRLWRLGVAESDTWTEGDEDWGRFTVLAGGRQLGELPIGRYRLQCGDLRAGAEDPPEFSVAAGANSRVLGVAHRRWCRVRLVLLDDAGNAITHSVNKNMGGSSSSGVSESAPDWAKPRRSKLGRSEDHGAGAAIGCGFGGPPGDPVDADPAGFFDLGLRQEQARTGRSSLNYLFRSGVCADVDVQFDDAIHEDTTFVGSAPRVATLRSCVRQPDGTPVDPATVYVEARSVAVRCAWDAPPDAWRRIPVKVTVTGQGGARFERLTFVWTADTADQTHRLIPR